jgi:hypothetical protein
MWQKSISWPLNNDFKASQVEKTYGRALVERIFPGPHTIITDAEMRLGSLISSHHIIISGGN